MFAFICILTVHAFGGLALSFALMRQDTPSKPNNMPYKYLMPTLAPLGNFYSISVVLSCALPLAGRCECCVGNVYKILLLIES